MSGFGRASLLNLFVGLMEPLTNKSRARKRTSCSILLNFKKPFHAPLAQKEPFLTHGKCIYEFAATVLFCPISYMMWCALVCIVQVASQPKSSRKMWNNSSSVSLINAPCCTKQKKGEQLAGMSKRDAHRMDFIAGGHVAVRGSKGSQLVLVNYLSNVLKELSWADVAG